jgi:hypothetical protein
MGRRHIRLLNEYATLLGRVRKALHDDCARFRPAAGTYSPYGALYGFSSRLLEHMALKATQPNAVARFSLEDVFVAGGPDKLAWVGGWRKLPHVPREVAKLFEYPQQFAEEVFGRIERALRVDGAKANAATENGRLFVLADASIPELRVEFVLSSDRQAVAAGKAVACDATPLLHSRLEGEFLVSYQTPGGWVAITKDVLTDVVGAGRDARVDGLPPEAAEVLKLMCPELVAKP